jgi:hypothetical protein
VSAAGAAGAAGAAPRGAAPPGGGRRWTPGRLARAVAARLFAAGESRVYRMPAERAAALAGGDEFARDALADFDHYAPDNPWDRPADAQRAEVAARLRAGAHCYTLVERGRLLHHSYLEAPAASIELDYGLGDYPLPPGAARLWDDNTHSAARGRGLHQASLRRRARDAGRTPGVDWVYIVVRADNGPSRHNIEKVGFEHAGGARYAEVLGVRVRGRRRGA